MCVWEVVLQTQYVSFENANKVWQCWTFSLLCSSNPYNISEVFLHKTLYILVSSLCLTGDVKTFVSSLCGDERQWGRSSTYAPCYQYRYQWDQSLCTPMHLMGRAAAVPEATNLLSSALPAEGNQPKKKIMSPSQWNKYSNSHTHFSRRPACKISGFSKKQLGRDFFVVSLFPFPF